jgi:uncharacterized membrane protein YeaQ/YmgE (transglycosylase-associated protein family)
MIWSIIIGLVVGIIAKAVMPGKDPGGVIVTSLLGIAGAALASWVGGSLGFYQLGEPVGFIAAVAGAMVILLFYRVLAANHAAA